MTSPIKNNPPESIKNYLRRRYLVAKIANVFAALVVIARGRRIGQTIVIFFVHHVIIIVVIRRVTSVLLLLLLVTSRTVIPIVAVVSGESGCSCNGRCGNSIGVMVIVTMVMRMLFIVLFVFIIIVHGDSS